MHRGAIEGWHYLPGAPSASPGRATQGLAKIPLSRLAVVLGGVLASRASLGAAQHPHLPVAFLPLLPLLGHKAPLSQRWRGGPSTPPCRWQLGNSQPWRWQAGASQVPCPPIGGTLEVASWGSPTACGCPGSRWVRGGRDSGPGAVPARGGPSSRPPCTPAQQVLEAQRPAAEQDGRASGRGPLRL